MRECGATFMCVLLFIGKILIHNK